MAVKCPYCNSVIEGEPALPQLSDRKRRIYMAIAAAGSAGLKPAEILRVMYGETEPPKGAPVIMRVQVHGLNRIIARVNQKIRGKRYGTYTLTKLK